MPNNNTISNIAVTIETRYLPVIFFYFSFKHMVTLYFKMEYYAQMFNDPSLTTVNTFVMLSSILILIILIPFNFLIGYALIISKNLHQKPEGYLEVFVPLIATFWFLTYNIVPYLNAKLNFLVIPKQLLPYSVIIGSILAAVGLIIASISIYRLRMSFGIVVQVRDIVTKGLYRYVRHPIYFGHIIAHIGFFLIMLRFYALILSTLLVLITLFRAKLEERKLSNYSQDYREYMAKTPFIIPYKIK